MAFRFAVTGMERSGTYWLAALLDDDPAVKVRHEPTPLKVWDSQVLPLAYDGTLDTASFAKARYNYWRNTSPNHADQAEVNSVIRYVAGAIRDVWDIPVAAIVRDGRLTVRSLLRRGTFQRPNMPPFPAPAEVAADPFAACCWYWADAYERLQAQDIPIWRLEDLNGDWATVERLCDYLNLAIRKTAWDWLKGRRLNESTTDAGPPQWDEQQAATFDQWAGEVQAQFGYERAA